MKSMHGTSTITFRILQLYRIPSSTEMQLCRILLVQYYGSLLGGGGIVQKIAPPDGHRWGSVCLATGSTVL